MGKEPFNYNEFKEITESLHHMFRGKQITEDEYRRGLARHGFNATAIDAEVLARKMEDF